MDFVINLLITIATFMSYPFLKFKIIKKDIEYTNSEKKKTIILNSIIVAILFIIVGSILYGDNYQPNFLPAVLYYFINMAIYIKKEK